MSVGNGQRKLLLIDDDQMLRELLEAQLAELGISITAVEDPEGALRALRKEKFHAVLSDIVMPTKSGLELLSEVRTENPDLPFVFLTGYLHEQNLLQAIRLGATDILTKPTSNKTLIDVIAKAVEIGEKQEEIEDRLRELASQSPLLKREMDAMTQKKKQISLLKLVNNKNRKPKDEGR